MSGVIRVGILGATGRVGQVYVAILRNHPFFELSSVAASPESVGKTLAEALHNRSFLTGDIPNLTLVDPHTLSERADLIFSCIDGDIAYDLETKYAQNGCAVISNSSAHRQDTNVPICIPEINKDHLSLIHSQETPGFIVTKPNCTLQSFLLPLYPLHKLFTLTDVIITSMQALSGGGAKALFDPEIMGNVFPYIANEEEKLETEPLKILGDNSINIAAHCNRVPTVDGHLVTVSAKFKQTPKLEEVLDAWRAFEGLDLPTAPLHPVVYMHEEDRPQPKLDVNLFGGMSAITGRLRTCPVLDIRFTSLSHNLKRGAAGGGVLIAEQLYQQGHLHGLKKSVSCSATT